MANGDRVLPSLNEVLVAFQKSLARVWWQTQEDIQNNTWIQEGKAPFFTVEALEVELRVGLDVVSASEEFAPDIVRVNFDDQLHERSTVKFRVGLKPLAHEGVRDREARHG